MMSLVLRPNWLYLAAGIFMAVSFPSRAQVDQIIYTDALANGWQDWGWATINYSNASSPHSGSYSVSVNCGAYQGIKIHHAAFDASLYTNLTFWIRGASNIGQPLQLQALTNDTPGLAYVLPAVTTTWQQFTVSLAQVGVANVTNMDGFWIQNRTGNSLTFYVDDIKLTAVPPPAVVNISLNATQIVRGVDARTFGVNGAVWDSYFDTSATISLLTEMGNQTLRFPGGSFSDEYHWAAAAQSWETSFDEFAHVATNTGAHVFLTVNYGSGTPSEAANWVRHANLTNHYGFKHWEIGNENYGDWETDTNVFPHDPYTYATRAKEYFDQMKAADPTVKVGVVVVTGEDSYSNGYTDHTALNPRTGQTHDGWTPVLLTTLKNLGVTPDFVIFHKYPQWIGNDDAYLLQSSSQWTADATDLRQQLTDYLGAAATNTEIVCTENNGASGYGPQASKQSVSIVNGLYLADAVGWLLRTEFNAWIWWDLRNGQQADTVGNQVYGWRNYGDLGLIFGVTNRYPTFYAFKLLKHFVRGGDQMLGAASDYSLLSAHGTRRANGSVSLLAINKSPLTAFNANIQLTGYMPDSNAVIYSYGITQDEAARTGTGSPDIAQTNFANAGTNFSFTFPAYTATVISFVPSAPRLNPLSAQPEGQFQLQLQGQVGVPYVIQSSPDLISWLPVLTNTLSSNTVNWTDASTTNSGRQFYRAVWTP